MPATIRPGKPFGVEITGATGARPTARRLMPRTTLTGIEAVA
ncbi:hypothetical protein [Nocardia coffeae]|nr:hypothetical protein [Nocardia coffeae]